MSSSIPDFIIENASEWRPTEVFLPVEIGIQPIWMHASNTGGWCASATIPPRGLGDDFDPGADCEVACCVHGHPTKDEAWTCAEALGRAIAAAYIGGPEEAS